MPQYFDEIMGKRNTAENNIPPLIASNEANLPQRAAEILHRIPPAGILKKLRIPVEKEEKRFGDTPGVHLTRFLKEVPL